MLHILASESLHGAFHRKSAHPCSSRSNPLRALYKCSKQNRKRANLYSAQLLVQTLPWIQGPHDHHTAIRKKETVTSPFISGKKFCHPAEYMGTKEFFWGTGQNSWGVPCDGQAFHPSGESCRRYHTCMHRQVYMPLTSKQN